MRPHEWTLFLLIILVLAGGMFTEGYAAVNFQRSLAFLGTAIIGALSLLLFWSNLKKHEWIVASFFLIPLFAGGLLLIPIPSSLVGAISSTWADGLAAREASGLPIPSLLPIALDPEMSIRSLNLILASAALLLGLLAISKKRLLMVLLLYFVVILGLLEGIITFLNLMPLDGRPRGTLYNPNHSATLILMVIPVALALAYRRGMSHQSGQIDYQTRLSGDRWLILLALVLLAILGWISTLSRGSLLAAIVILGPWLLWESRVFLLQDSKIGKGQILALIVGVLLMGILLLWFAGTPGALAQRVDHDPVSYGRIDLWKTTIGGFVDSNMIGLGLGGGNVTLEMGVQNVATRKAPGWTHNDYVQYFCEIGIVGILLTIGWLILVTRRLNTTTIATSSWWFSRRHLLDRAMLAGLATVLVHSFVDFPLRIPSIAFCFLALLAITLSRLNDQVLVGRPAPTSPTGRAA